MSWRGARRAIPGIVVLVLVLGGIGLAAGLIRERSFSVPRVAIEATLTPDATMHVVEHITYSFRGSYHFGTRPIPVGAYEITDMRVTENGSPLVSEGAPYNLKWFFDASDETRTFDIAYTVRNAATVGPDVAELYWKWVGDAHPTIGEVTAVLTVPPGAGDVRAWGHGPLNGHVEIDGDTVRWRAAHVPLGTFVEGRVAMAASRFTVAPFGAPRRDRILAEERSWARAANLARAQAARDARDAERRRDIANVAVPILVVLGIAVFAFLFLRFGREPEPPEVGDYVRDLPDDPPAVVDTLRHWGKVQPLAFGATVVDLAQRGHLTITEARTVRRFLPDSTDYRFRRVLPAPADPLEEFERRVMDRLFDNGPESTQDEITKWAAAHQSTAHKWWTGFRASVRTAYDARRYQQSERGLVFAANLAVATIIGVAGTIALASQAWWVGGVAIAWAVLQALLTTTLRQRTPAGARRAAEWDGVERYLRDFSELEEAPVGHLVLWERYLVYAVALGVSADVARGLALRVPEVAQQLGTRSWYLASPDGGRGIGGIGGFGSGFGSSFAAASTPRSSGSGGGGGFSGGGGGGGGGGGIGAG